MQVLTDFPVSLELHSPVDELRMPFSDQVKYIILAISIMLLLIALGLMLWQAIRYCQLSRSAQGNANTELLNSDEMVPYQEEQNRTSKTKTKDAGLQDRRLSHCLSQGLFPPGNDSAKEDLEDSLEMEKIYGSLRFSLFFDQLQSCLVVTVLQAEGLRGRSLNSRLHPFVRLRLMWAAPDEDEREGGEGRALRAVFREWQTRVVNDSCRPQFGDQFSCRLQQREDLQHITLRMEVKDFDKFSRHVVLGEVKLPLSGFHSTYPLELQEALQAPQKDLVGEVLLSLKFLPTSQRLEVGVLKIKTLPTEIRPDTALYARIRVQCNQYKLRHQKTTSIPQQQVTVFNQVFVFSLPEVQLEECMIVVLVYEMHTTRKSSKHLIGQLTVQKSGSSEDQHWRLMMQSMRQPIAEWHQLLI